MRTTLDLPDPLFKEVKTRAVQQGVTLKDLLATYIEAGLRGALPAEPDSASPKKRPPLPVAIPRIPGAPLHPALTNAELHALLADEDLAEHQRVIAQPSKPE
jgi:hypothetical protein